MRLEINRLTMLEVAKSVAKVAPSNSHVDGINGILVEGDKDIGEVYLTATNYEASIQQKVFASVAESGTVLVNARLLVDMMSKLEGEFVILSADKPELLKVTGGRCTFQIACLSPSSYPKPVMPFPEETVLMTGICSLAKRTTFLVSKDESKPALQCIQVKFKNSAIHAAACDGIRMMLVKDSAEQTDECEFLLPGRSLQLLASVSSDSDVFEVGDLGREVVFVRGDMIFTIRKLSTGDFMDTNSIIKSINPAYSAVADVSEMKEGLNLISIGALAKNIRVPINLVFSKGEIILRCNSDYSDAATVLPAKISQDTPDTGFFYDVSALLKLFQVVSGKVKLEIDAKGFMLIKTRSEVYLQGPVRPSAKTEKPVKQTANKSSPQSEQGHDKEQNRAKGAKDVKEVAA